MSSPSSFQALVHSLHHESHFSPPPQSAGWVSPPSTLIYSAFFPPGYCWRGPPCPTQLAQPLFSTRLDFHSRVQEHTPSSNTTALSYLCPTLPAVSLTPKSLAVRGKPGKLTWTHTYIGIHLFHSFSLFAFIIEGLAWNWIALGFHGRRLWLVQRERLFVAFN